VRIITILNSLSGGYALEDTLILPVATKQQHMKPLEESSEGFLFEETLC